MTIIISRAGIEGTNIKPDSPEWTEWFSSQPEGTKIQFTWTDDSFKEQKFTAYRRKRYWEAQKRVSGKLRNTTLKPGEVTYEALRQMGLKLTSYNWADKFEYEESGKGENYQTQNEVFAQTGTETEELRARLAALEQSNSELQAANQALEKQLSECSLQLKDTQRALEREADDAKRYYVLWRRYPDLERKNKYLQERVDAFEAAPLKILDGWIESAQIDLKPRTADKLRAYREYLLRSSRSDTSE
jgi:hypothetical protein